MGNFQGTYERPGNPWDLKSCRQKVGESLRDYIRCFSKECNAIPNEVDADIIGAFISGTTCKILVRKLGRKGPRTTKELLDIATNHAFGEDAVGEIFDRAQGGKAKRDEAAGEGTSGHPGEKKNNKRKGGGEYVAAVEHKAGKAPVDVSPRFFDDLLEKPCPNHAYPVKHALKNCGLARKWFDNKWEKHYVVFHIRVSYLRTGKSSIQLSG